jgi:hypothetical protein
VKPKANLLRNDLGLHDEYIVAHKLRKTHAQLLRELGPGEMAYQRAFLELEREQYEQARRDAEHKTS